MIDGDVERRVGRVGIVGIDEQRDVALGVDPLAARSTSEFTPVRPGDDVLCGGLGLGGAHERSAVRAGSVGAPSAGGELARAAYGGGCSGDAGAV